MKLQVLLNLVLASLLSMPTSWCCWDLGLSAEVQTPATVAETPHASCCQSKVHSPQPKSHCLWGASQDGEPRCPLSSECCQKTEAVLSARGVDPDSVLPHLAMLTSPILPVYLQVATAPVRIEPVRSDGQQRHVLQCVWLC